MGFCVKCLLFCPILTKIVTAQCVKDLTKCLLFSKCYIKLHMHAEANSCILQLFRVNSQTMNYIHFRNMPMLAPEMVHNSRILQCNNRWDQQAVMNSYTTYSKIHLQYSDSPSTIGELPSLQSIPSIQMVHRRNSLPACITWNRC